jgi:hypothetical protein
MMSLSSMRSSLAELIDEAGQAVSEALGGETREQKRQRLDAIRGKGLRYQVLARDENFVAFKTEIEAQLEVARLALETDRAERARFQVQADVKALRFVLSIIDRGVEEGQRAADELVKEEDE